MFQSKASLQISLRPSSGAVQKVWMELYWKYIKPINILDDPEGTPRIRGNDN